MNGTGPPRGISSCTVPELKNLPEDIRRRILAVQQESGFVPGVFPAFVHRPRERSRA